MRELLLRVRVDERNRVVGVFDAATGALCSQISVHLPPPLAPAPLYSGSVKWHILAFIEQYIAQYGRSPTHREIAIALGVNSTGHIFAHLTRLERDGYITRDPHITRSIRVLRSAPTAA